MCGICGYLKPRPSSGGSDALTRMASLIEHRGPDDLGVYADGPVGIAVRRLSIIDVEGGHQPIANEDGSIVVGLNGEIYNYADLRKELLARGHRLRTATDTEVIAHLYEEMGERCVDRLRGMFAFAVWDSRRQRLVLARDRLGIKPLFHLRTSDGTCIFASEIKSLLAFPGVSRSISPAALGLYLDLQYVPGRQTFFEGIERLPPGHLLIVDDTGAREVPYWDITPDEEASHSSLADNAARLKAELTEAIRLHMVADVPVGALLSGGLDSSVVVALAAQQTGHPLRTFNVSFEAGENSNRYDERPFARLIAQRYATEHTEVRFTAREVADLFPRVTWHLDEPFGNPTALATYVVSRAARQSVKVVLAGSGGDELFGGYPRYAFDRMVSLYQSVPGVVRRLALSPALRALRGAGLVRNNLSRLEAAPDATRQAAWHLTMAGATRSRLLTPEWHERTASSRAESALGSHLERAPGGAGFQDRMMYADLKTWVPDLDLMQADRMSMMASLELRVPLLDHRIVEFTAGVPFGQKVRLYPLETKRLLRLAFRDELPSEILTQRKAGFFVPAGKWLRDDLRPLALDLLSPDRLRRQGIFRPEAVAELLSAHLSRAAYHGNELWALLSFQQWYDTVLEGHHLEGLIGSGGAPQSKGELVGEQRGT